jgi:hypothetical protein
MHGTKLRFMRDILSKGKMFYDKTKSTHGFALLLRDLRENPL